MPPLMQNTYILTKPKLTYFDEQKALTLEGMVGYPPSTLWYFNNVTKFHEVAIKIIGLTDRIPSKMVNFHKQRAITLEGMLQYIPLLYLKKTLWY